MTRRIRLALAAGFVLVLAGATPVFAHSELVESDPADGATIVTPYTLTAAFSEEFDPNPQRSFVLVEDSAGDEVARGGVSADDPAMMTVDLRALEPGAYTVRWQTTTADDQGVERDSFTFDVAASPTPPPTATPARPNSPVATMSPAQSQGPIPTATPASPIGPVPTGGNDVVLALILAGVVIGAVGIFLFTRTRR